MRGRGARGRVCCGSNEVSFEVVTRWNRLV